MQYDKKDDGSKLLFNFEEKKNAKFGIKEFKTITTLKCGSLPIVDMEKLNCRFLEKYFNKKEHIPKSRVSFLFNYFKRSKDEDRVKITKLYFLSNFLLGKHRNKGRCGSYQIVG